MEDIQQPISGLLVSTLRFIMGILQTPLTSPTSSGVSFEREKGKYVSPEVGPTWLGMSGFFEVLPLLLAAICCYFSLSVLKKPILVFTIGDLF